MFAAACRLALEPAGWLHQASVIRKLRVIRRCGLAPCSGKYEPLEHKEVVVTSVLNQALSCIVGAVAVEQSEEGVQIHRTPGRTRAQLADSQFDYASAIPSGVRIELVTDGKWIELELALARAIYLGDPAPSSFIDVVVDGQLRPPLRLVSETIARFDPADGKLDIDQAGPSAVRIELGDRTVCRTIEIWLPNASKTVLLDVRVPDGSIFVPAPRSRARWIHHGSSISQCSEADRPTSTWPALVARQAGLSLVNLGLAGQCHLDQALARTIRSMEAEVISLELGINIVAGDTMRERTFVSAFHGFLDTIRETRPHTPILIISPIYCGSIEETPGVLEFHPIRRVFEPQHDVTVQAGMLSLLRTRVLLERHVADRGNEGDANLHYLNGLDLFGPADVPDLPDNLHPNTAGYGRMAERFLSAAFGPNGSFPVDSFE